MQKNKADRGGVVDIARTWLGTPYVHMARVIGSGVDCAMMPLKVYSEAGLIREVTVEGDPSPHQRELAGTPTGVTDPDIPYYPPDWHLHRDAERYLEKVTELVTERGGAELDASATPRPGDFILIKFARAYSHGAIVIDWPICIHAHLHRGVVLVDVLRDPKMGEKIRRGFMKVFSFWGEE